MVHNHWRKQSYLLSLGLLAMACFNLAYADGQCQSSSGMINSIMPMGNGTYLRFAVPPDSLINFNINLSDYSQMVDRALLNEPLGTVGIPACIAVSNASSASAAWNSSDLAGSPLIKIEMNAPESSYTPHLPDSVSAIALTGSSGYQLAAIFSFCPCSQYTIANSSCNGFPAEWAINSTGTLIKANTFFPEGGTAGICADNTGAGGLMFDVYSQEDEIPYVGQYSANYSFGVAPNS